MLKVFEYECVNPECLVTGQQHERFINSGEEDIQICTECHNDVKRVYSATKGYVKGTSNPCKC